MPERRIVASIALILLVVAGCSGPAATPSAGSESIGPPSPASQAASVLSLAPVTGPSQSGAARPPLPERFPAPPDAEVLPLPADDPDLAARWSSGRNGAEVYAYYLDALPMAGFTLTGRYPGGAAAVIALTDAQGTAWELAIYGADTLTVELRRVD